MSIESLSKRGAGGFSLLEMLVAISILGLSLGALYQAASGATRNVRAAERFAYGVEMGRSLIAQHSVVPPGGVQMTGETGSGFVWRVESAPVRENAETEQGARLHALQVQVSWPDGLRRREILLDTVVAEAKP